MKYAFNTNEQVCDACNGRDPWGPQTHVKLPSGRQMKLCNGCLGTDRARVLADTDKNRDELEEVKTALKKLVDYCQRVEADICDQDTGWFYQWSATTEKAARLIRED